MHQRNVGTLDRALRAIIALACVATAVASPLALPLRIGVFGGLALYLAITALAGTCLGYRLMGRSTCPTRARS